MTQGQEPRGFRRQHERGDDRPPHPSGHYENEPSLTNRQWGPSDARPDSWMGYRGIGGYGDFRQGNGDYQPGQGGYGQDQGRYAQSGHGRGGSDYGDRQARDARPSHRGRGPRDYQRPDDRIADDLNLRLADDEHIDASEILVIVDGGVVTLTGEVPERHMKHLAEDLAAAARGVREVHNRIKVDNGEASFGPPGRPVRSGQATRDAGQMGSGFSSSGRIDEPLEDTTTRVGRAGTESSGPAADAARVRNASQGRGGEPGRHVDGMAGDVNQVDDGMGGSSHVHHADSASTPSPAKADLRPRP